MKFGPVQLEEAEGTILAHSQRLPGGGRLAKGTRLGAAEIERLRAAGFSEVTAAMLEPGDVAEDEAAGTIGAVLAVPFIRAAPPATGRINLFAEHAGLFLPKREIVDALNAVDPGITLATLPAFAPVEAGRMVATVKVIPLAVPGAAVDEAVRRLRETPALSLAPYRAHSVGLIQTELPGIKPSVLDKTRRATEERLRPSGSSVGEEIRCRHDVDSLARALADMEAAELILVFGASAVIDEGDVIPAAIRAAGGSIAHFGMPVDPGNLLLLGELSGRAVMGAPGCARSSKENGFDWILNRLLADLPVTPQDITGLGVGGLLMEIAARPQPREQGAASTRPKVAAVILAAGRSSRMGGPNKLLAEFDGVPLVRRATLAALSSKAAPVFVVVGHRQEAVRQALADLDVRIVENPDFAQGLASSLKAGFLAATSEGADGVLVMLADQPLVGSEALDRMIGAFSPSEEGSIVLACDAGKRGNPVILSAAFADEIAQLTGDVGARGIVAANAELVREVELGPAASLDVDTPEAMAAAGGIFPEGA